MKDKHMNGFKHLPGVSTLSLDPDLCTGCEECISICPHLVFEMIDRKAKIVDHDACMECGACANNCPSDAVTVTPGVGCAAYIIKTWLNGRSTASGSSPGCC